MGLLRRLLFPRSGRLGALSDLAVVGTTAARLARGRSSAAGGRSGASVPPGQLLLAGAAVLRLLARFRRRRRDRRALVETD